MLLLICIGVVVFAPVFFIVFYNFYYKRRNLPPGPTPLPLVGNLLDIVKQGSGEDAFIKWKRQFGDVYTYWMGEQPIVAVNDYSKIVDTFQKDSETFAGRTFAQELRVYVGGDVMRGVLLTEGEVWRDQRRFALHVLRDFGMGKNLMQERVLDEVTGVISALKQDILRKYAEHDLPVHLDIGVGSVINALLFGYRWDKEREKEFFELKEMMSEFIKAYVHP
ncbi:Protein CYP-33C1, partial [Aphelenchoides avenae]